MTCKIEYENILKMIKVEIYFTKQEIEKDRFDKNKFDICFNWTTEVLNCFNDLSIVYNIDDYYSLIMDLLVLIIKKFKLGNENFKLQLLYPFIIVYFLLSKKSLRDLGDANVLIYYTSIFFIKSRFS